MPSQVCCSLELHFVSGSSKRIGYFDWIRELVLRIGYFTRASALGIVYMKFLALEPTLAGTRFFKGVEPQFRFSIWNRVESSTRRNRPSLPVFIQLRLCVTFLSHPVYAPVFIQLRLCVTFLSHPVYAPVFIQLRLCVTFLSYPVYAPVFIQLGLCVTFLSHPVYAPVFIQLRLCVTFLSHPVYAPVFLHL